LVIGRLDTRAPAGARVAPRQSLAGTQGCGEGSRRRPVPARMGRQFQQAGTALNSLGMGE